MKNVLIVGGAGYVGGAITDLVADQKYNVRVYDSLLYEDSYRKEIDFVFGDVRDTERLRPHLRWADTVVWLAAIVGDGACQLKPELTVAVNEEPLKWLAANYDGRIIFMSTCSVYGAQDRELDEDSPTSPLSLYASTKLRAESFLKQKNAMIFRLGTLFGVGDLYARIRMDLVVNALTVRAHTQGMLSVFGGDQFRPLLHVKDVARAVVQNLRSEHTGIFNLHRQNVRIVDLAYQVRNHFPDCIIERSEMPFQDTRNYRVSSRKAREVFGFNPVHSIDDGIMELKFLVETGRIKDVNAKRYSNQAFLSTQLQEEKKAELVAA
ncbi:MAG: NAD(P)-dependent oxidoreductase [Bacteroidetes bacterium]|nr:MAG: NAD(P)-dependent oxidoreductase [Bacteroidota bacterium]